MRALLMMFICSVTLAAQQSLILSFEDVAQAGALRILKNSTKGGAKIQRQMSAPPRRRSK